MSEFWHRFVQRPQRLRLRWWLFQIHLWTGIILALYFVVVGLSGSILVFREELTALGNPELVSSPHPGAPLAEIETVLADLQRAHPDHKAANVMLPSLYSENFRSFLVGEPTLMAYSDRASGALVGVIDRDASWITWMQQLHFYLLAGKPGLIANGVGGLFLILLCGTGLVLWWPGIRRWTRALVIDFRTNWKRFNWDLHSVVGFWTLPIVFIWGLTGAFFAWPQQFVAAVNVVSPVTTLRPPKFKVEAPTDPAIKRNIGSVIALAVAREPNNRLSGVQIPNSPSAPVAVMMARGELWNTRSTNYLYFDAYRSEYLGEWRRGINETLGDEVIFQMGPLHFGVYWGMTIKILWAVLGLALPGLAITGCIMYWNRSLGPAWRRMRAGARAPGPAKSVRS